MMASTTTTASATKKPKPRSYFREWCEMTGWHGILDFQKSTSFLSKASWSIVILFGAFLAANQCVSLMLDFTSDDQWTTSVTYETPNEGLDWPNITVGNLNKMTKTRVQQWATGLDFRNLMPIPYLTAYAISADAESLLFYDRYQADEPILHSRRDADSSIDRLRNKMATIMGSDFTSTDKQAYFPHCNQTAIHCGLSTQFDLTKTASSCCEQESAYEFFNRNYFSVVSSAAFGKSNKNSGQSSGVYILLNPKTTDYIDQVTKSSAPSAGLQLDLYYGNPDAAVLSSLLLAPGTHTMVSIVKEKHRANGRRLKTLQLFQPKKPCIDKQEYHQINFDTYSVPLCIMDCSVKYSMAVCKCNPTTSSFGFKNAIACKGYDLVNCTQKWAETVSQMRNEMANDTEINALLQCWTLCDEACEYDTVDTKVSTAQFPAAAKVQAFTTYLNRAYNGTELNFTDEETRQLIYFEMYFEMKEQRVIEKVTRTSLDELIGNLGGALGVWTGLSILSIYQCLIYFLKGAFNWFKHRNRDSNVVEILY